MKTEHNWINTLNSMTSDYYGFSLSTAMWLNVLEDSPIIETELAYGAIRDTDVRDIVICAVCRVIGIREWPTHSEEDVMAEFIKEFENRIKEVGGTVND